MTERIGILGGTYNPPHLGHLHAAQAARDALGLTRVIFVPAFLPPHKELPKGSPDAEARLAMARLAADEMGAEVSDLEIRSGKISYTADTLQAFRTQFPDAEFWLIVGGDMFLTLQDWVRPKEIFAAARIAVVARESGELSRLRAHKEYLERAFSCGIDLVEAHPLPVSSTELRQSLNGEYLPDSVFQYIRAHGYYQSPYEEIRRTIEKQLSPKRYRHTMGCAECAVWLARRFDADVDAAYCAGLLHDCTKEWDAARQLKFLQEHDILLDNVSKHTPQIWHAITGAIWAQEQYSVSEEVAGAIRWHTTGRAGMTRLEQILWIADLIEPSRDFPGISELREANTLHTALLRGFDQSLAHLVAKGSLIHPSMIEARNSILLEDKEGIR